MRASGDADRKWLATPASAGAKADATASRAGSQAGLTRSHRE